MDGTNRALALRGVKMTRAKDAVLAALAAATGRTREGRAASGLLLDGRRVGTWRAWRSDGSLLVRVGYVAGRRHGAWTRWFRDGSLALSLPYVGGLATGDLQAWYPSGTPALRASVIAGSLHGPVCLWAEDGVVVARGAFEGGELNLRPRRRSSPRDHEPEAPGPRLADPALTGWGHPPAAG
jgi:hypothetical protein